MSILYLAALTSNYVTDIKTFNSFEIKLVITQNIIYFVDGQAVRFCKNTQNQIARCIYLGITGRFLSGRLIREILRMPYVACLNFAYVATFYLRFQFEKSTKI